MSRVIGEAKWDPTAGRWYFIIYIDNGDVIFESDHVFDSQEEAEDWLVKALRGLASEFPPEPQEGNPKRPKP